MMRDTDEIPRTEAARIERRDRRRQTRMVVHGGSLRRILGDLQARAIRRVKERQGRSDDAPKPGA